MTRPLGWMWIALIVVGVISTCVMSTGVVRAEEDGLAELDRAVDAKLNARSVPELGKVIEYCQSALRKGLDEANTEFAEKLLASTLIQRATAIGDAILNQPVVDPQIAQQAARLREQAIADLKQALDIEAEHPEAQLLLGRLYASQPGGDEAARAALDEAIGLAGEDGLLKARALAARALLLEDIEQRNADLDAAVELSPRDDEILRMRAMSYIEQQQSEKALADLERAIELSPDHGPTHEVHGVVLGMLGRLDEALAAFDRAIELNPDSLSAHLQRSRIHLLKSQPDEAVDDLDHVLSTQPATPALLLLRATAYQQLGDLERALTDVEQVLRVQPRFGPALRLRGVLLAGTGKLDDAVTDLKTALEDDPQDEELLLQLATLYRMKKQTPTAIEYYTQVIEAAPEGPLGYQGRADAYLSIGKQAEALADYEQALKLEPENTSVLNNLAWLLATSPNDDLRDGARSIELGTKAAELTEYKQAHILSTLAAGYAESGDFETAKKWSQKAVDTGSPELQEPLRKELESYQRGEPWRELQQEDATETPAEDDTPAEDETPAEDDTPADDDPSAAEDAAPSDDDAE